MVTTLKKDKGLWLFNYSAKVEEWQMKRHLLFIRLYSMSIPSYNNSESDFYVSHSVNTTPIVHLLTFCYEVLFIIINEVDDQAYNKVGSTILSYIHLMCYILIIKSIYAVDILVILDWELLTPHEFKFSTYSIICSIALLVFLFK